MKVEPVGELWADLIGEPVERRAAPAAAKAANAAKREDSRGMAAGCEPCEALRMAANAARAAGAGSQGFAGVRSGENGPQGEQSCGSSQNSQDSQGCPDAMQCGAPADDLSAVAWSDGDVSRFLDRRARLLRWGWGEADAERLADRLVRRDREGDERVSCTDCLHYRAGRCSEYGRAGLRAPEVGRNLAGMLQRCPAFNASGDVP